MAGPSCETEGRRFRQPGRDFRPPRRQRRDESMEHVDPLVIAPRCLSCASYRPAASQRKQDIA